MQREIWTYVFLVTIRGGDDGREVLLRQEVAEERHVGLVLVISSSRLVDVGDERTANC